MRNFESGKPTINDSNGSPIAIAAVVVWEVVDTAEGAHPLVNTGSLYT